MPCAESYYIGSKFYISIHTWVDTHKHTHTPHVLITHPHYVEKGKMPSTPLCAFTTQTTLSDENTLEGQIEKFPEEEIL